MANYCFIMLCWFLSCNSVNQPPVSSVQSLSRVRLFVTPWIAARQASLSIIISGTSLRLTSIESVMPSSHLTLCRPLLLLPPVSPSISPKYTYIPSLLNLLATPTHPTPLGCHRALVELPVLHSNFPQAMYLHMIIYMFLVC